MEPEAENIFQDAPPRKDFWLLFKVSSYERLLQMQSGTLYMNSLDYFSNLKDEEALALRMDELEKVYGVLRAGKNTHGYSTLSIKIGDSDEEIDLGPEAVLRADFPQPKNMMLFCMGAFADGKDGKIAGETGSSIFFDRRFLEFGSHLLLITNAPEFAKRISLAIGNEAGAFSTVFFHDGYGLVHYKALDNYSGAIGLYTKDLKYSWQLECRISLGVQDQCLNCDGAYELEIGDISDISQIVPVQAMIDHPMTVKRRTYKTVGDSYELLPDASHAPAANSQILS